MFIAALIYPASQAYGLTGVALVIVGNAAVANPITHYLALRVVDGGWAEFLRLLAYPAAGATAMALCVLGVQRGLADVPPAVELAATIGVGVVAYAAAMLGVERLTRYDLAGLVGTIRDSLG